MMDMPPMTLEQAQRLYEGPAYVQMVDEARGGASGAAAAALVAQQNDARRARSQALLDTALGVGVKAGIAWQLDRIQRNVRANERALDTIYDFGDLMIQGRVVPPVIIKSTDLYNQDGDLTLRLSGAYYKIESQAKFSSIAPSWRGYLSFPQGGRSSSSFDMIKPQSSAEKRLWEQGVSDGWRQGIEQANIMLEHSMDRLNRDFIGMLQFHEFVLQGKISMPVIASESIPVINDGSTMTVDETLLRITTLSAFDGDMKKWIGLAPGASHVGQEQKPWITSAQPQAATPGVETTQIFPVAGQCAVVSSGGE